MRAHDIEAALDALVDASPSVAGTRAFLALRKAAIAMAKEADTLRTTRPEVRWRGVCVMCEKSISQHCETCKAEIANRRTLGVKSGPRCG